jgi:hypothetical protein
MNEYSVVLFVHIVGALGVFMALGLEWTGLTQLRSATAGEQVRAWMSVLKNVRKVGFISMLTTVITGIYLMVRFWGGVAWIIVTLGSLVLIIALAQALTAPRMAAVGQALAMSKGAITQEFYTRASHPRLWISIQTRAAIALGIVFLKIAKPDLIGSLLAVGVAIVLGILSSLYMPRREQLQATSTD